MAAEPGKRIRAGVSWVRPKLDAARTLLAFKAALAAVIAYAVAPHVPGVAEEYPYYAPLGALISMYPTLMGSAKAGLQTLAGLAIGILLASMVIVLGIPPLPGVAFVVLVGFLVAGSGWLGAGKEYVPMAAMFVLIIGGPDADAYSLGYLVQMGLGVAVGLAVNLLVLPPLHLNAAASKISDFRTTLAGQLDDIGEALTEDWPPEHEDWSKRSHDLDQAAAAVRGAVIEADESRKGNPRARLHRRDLPGDFADLETLENITFHVRDLSDVLASAVWGKPFPVALPPRLCPPISAALHATASLLRAWDSGTDTAPRLSDADAAQQELLRGMDQEHHEGAMALSPAASVAMALKRITDGIRLRIDPTGADTP